MEREKPLEPEGGMLRANSASPVLLLTARDAARALAISPRSLWSYTASGEIPHVRIGRSVRYPLNGLQRWIDHQKKGGATR